MAGRISRRTWQARWSRGSRNSSVTQAHRAKIGSTLAAQCICQYSHSQCGSCLSLRRHLSPCQRCPTTTAEQKLEAMHVHLITGSHKHQPHTLKSTRCSLQGQGVHQLSQPGARSAHNKQPCPNQPWLQACSCTPARHSLCRPPSAITPHHTTCRMEP